jgi:pimeloyl-ACP methyl ester carboxylesterase
MGGLLLTSPSIEIENLNQIPAIDSGYAEVNGTRLYYETAGTGTPIVLIHGSFGDRRHWDFQFREFAKKYKVIRYDVRGYGKSALPNADIAYTDSEDLSLLMDFLKVNKAHICGLSMGSIIAIDFVLSHANRCISLIVIGPRVAGDGAPEYRTLNPDSINTSISEIVEIVKKRGAKEGTDSLWTGNNPLSKAVRSHRTLEALLKMGYEYSWWRYLYANKRSQAFPMAIKKLNEIKTPTLVVTAEYDLALCKNVAKIIVDEVPGAKLVSILGAGHIMNMDKPEKLNEIIFRYIKKLKIVKDPEARVLDLLEREKSQPGKVNNS